MITLPRHLTSQRGLSLTEFVIVAAIASLVMAGLMSFYMNSQATWSDGFAQAISQREATSVIEDISNRVRRSSKVVWEPLGVEAQLDLFDADDPVNPAYSFRWSYGDSLMRSGPYNESGGWEDRGLLATSLVEQFAVVYDSSLVDVFLQMRSTQNERVELSTRIMMNNR